MSEMINTIIFFTSLFLGLFSKPIPKKSCLPVALTFDDGPMYPYTPLVLKILKQQHISATFFLLGKNIEKNPELVKQIISDGHEIGNHTYNHPYLTVLDSSQLQQEIEKTNKILEKVTGNKVLLFRSPYGSLNDNLMEVENKLGLKGVDWSIDPVNWSDAKPIVSVDTIINQVTSKSIILLHDGIEEKPKVDHDIMDNVNKLPEIITKLRSMGYCFSTVSNLNSTGVCNMCQ